MIEVPAADRTAGAPADNVSFRDPSGRLFCHRGRVLRVVNPHGMEELEAFLATLVADRFEREGKLVGTRFLDKAEAAPLGCGFPRDARMLEHEAIPFPSYPYEWPTEMLHAAGELTLEFAEGLLGEGFGLKDATPYNVLFRGPRPVFIDLLSFERRRAGDPTWLAEAQFVRTFLLPLLAVRRFGFDTGCWLAGRRDGLDPAQVYVWLGTLERLARPWLTLVTLPTWLGASADAYDERLYRPRLVADAEKAEFIVAQLYRRLKRMLRRAAPARRADSPWSSYMDDHAHYSADDFRAKEEFVRSSLDGARPRWVLDAGSNTGHFSRMAATRGASVVSIDSDAAVVGATWRMAAEARLDILPLVVDLARPTPSMGWRNRECRSFVNRAAGHFDMVLMLALLHHLLAGERIPLDEILDLGFELTRRHLLVEYVGPTDPMFRRVARGRDALHAELTPQSFERSCQRRFDIVRKASLDGGRILFLLRKVG